MLSLPWLCRRSDGLWFTARVPAAIARKAGRRVLTRSLRTKDPEVARIRLHGLSMAVAVAFSQISKRLPELTEADIRWILDEALTKGVRQFDRQIAIDGSSENFDLVRELERQKMRIDTLRVALRQNNLAPVDSSASQILTDAGVEFDIASVEYRVFLRRRLAMEIRRAEIEMRRLEGDYSDELPDSRPVPALPSTVSVSANSCPPIQGRVQGLLEAFEKFKAEWLRAKRRPKTLDQYKQSLMLFIELFGDLRCCDLTASHGVEFKEKLLQIPVDYRQAKKLRPLSVPEIVKRRLVEKGRRPLALKTLNRHLGALCTFGKWLGKNRYLAPIGNPFGGLFLPIESNPREERHMHSLDDLRKLFLSPVWSGCQSRGRRSEPGPLVVKDAKFFVPLLGLYGGLRLEEACQLLRSDVREEKGVWIIDVRLDTSIDKNLDERKRKRVKSKNAIRQIPVHPLLISAGLIDYVRKGTSKLLFNDLSRENKYGSAGAGFTQWFGRYRRKVGCRERFKDFHSLRHNFITCAINAGVEMSIVEKLDGHRVQGETRSRYHKGYEIETLHQAVCKVAFGIETELLAVIGRETAVP